MKTIINQQQPLLCEGRFSLRSWLLDLRYAIRIYLSVALRKSSRLASKTRLRLASVAREILAGLGAVVNSATVNARIYTGWLIIGIVAPLSATFYHRFDSALEIASMPYHGNWYYLFHAISPWMYDAILCVGVYHLFPSGSKRSYILVAAFGWLIAKCVHISLATSNEEWHQSASWPLIVMGISFAIIFFISIDWFAWRKFHKFDSIPARIKGIISTPGIDADTKLKMIEPENNKLFNFHKEF